MTPALEIKDLKKTYASGTVALKGVSLTVPAGDFYALLGPNGAGKTTLIGIVTSLVNKTSGTVKVFGHDIDTDFEKAKTYIGLVGQELNFNPFEQPLDIVVNQGGYYGLPRSVAIPRAKKLLTDLGLGDKMNQQSMQLSGGMKRRLMIARALIHEPRFLILDEPTAGVDVELRRSMWGLPPRHYGKRGHNPPHDALSRRSRTACESRCDHQQGRDRRGRNDD